MAEPDDTIRKIAHADSADAIFDGFMKLSELVHQIGREKAKACAERRREKARTRYAIKKQLGLLPDRKRKEPEPEPEYEAPTSCYCSATPMPPCGWCERGPDEDDDA